MIIALVIAGPLVVYAVQVALSRSSFRYGGAFVPAATALFFAVAIATEKLSGVRDLAVAGFAVLALLGIWYRERSRITKSKTSDGRTN